jgi:hypothetical protein
MGRYTVSFRIEPWARPSTTPIACCRFSCTHESVNGHIHPHIHAAGSLCTGSFGSQIREALCSGNLVDFFELICNLLNTYNPSSPYQRIEAWGGTSPRCCDCGTYFSDVYEEDDSFEEEEDVGSLCVAEHCTRSMCPDCAHVCSFCNEPICGRHRLACASPDHRPRLLTCPNCSTNCAECSASVCPDHVARIQDRPYCPRCAERANRLREAVEGNNWAAALQFAQENARQRFVRDGWNGDFTEHTIAPSAPRPRDRRPTTFQQYTTSSTTT